MRRWISTLMSRGLMLDLDKVKLDGFKAKKVGFP